MNDPRGTTDPQILGMVDPPPRHRPASDAHARRRLDLTVYLIGVDALTIGVLSLLGSALAGPGPLAWTAVTAGVLDACCAIAVLTAHTLVTDGEPP